MGMSREAIQAGHFSPAVPAAIRWQYPLPGDEGFRQALARVAALADEENLELVARGFPALAEAITYWRSVPGWAQMVEEWCEAHAAEIASGPKGTP